MLPLPTVIEKTPIGERHYDLLSKHLEARNVFLVGTVDEATAFSTIAQLLYLNQQDSERPISFYINSNGGSVRDGLAIMDTMNCISAPIITIGMAKCASMGAFLLAAGKKDANSSRKVLANCSIMTHQVSGGAGGQASDIVITANEMKALNLKLRQYLAKFSGRTLDEVIKISDRDTWMTAEQALEFGLIDEIIK